MNDKHSIDAVIAKAHFNEPDDAIFRDIFFDEQLSLLDAEILDLNSRLFQYKAKLDVNEHSKNITKINIDQTRFALKTREERLNARKTLLDDGNTSRASYLDILDIFNETKKQLEVAERELARQISDDQVIMAERQSLLASEKRRLFARGTEITSRLTVLDNEFSAAIRQLKGMIIRSPVNGTVDSMKIYTIGGLAKEGEELMRIVPTNDNAEIEATFSNNDIGFLKLGQTANIKLDAFPSSRFGHIEGVVADVSADARKDEQNNWSFTVRVTPRESTLKTPTSEHPLQPGMTASIDVITGKRRLISYFFAPIVEVIQGSLGER